MQLPMPGPMPGPRITLNFPNPRFQLEDFESNIDGNYDEMMELLFNHLNLSSNQPMICDDSD